MKKSLAFLFLIFILGCVSAVDEEKGGSGAGEIRENCEQF